jgi:hypothetical protein
LVSEKERAGPVPLPPEQKSPHLAGGSPGEASLRTTGVPAHGVAPCRELGVNA